MPTEQMAEATMKQRNDVQPPPPPPAGQDSKPHVFSPWLLALLIGCGLINLGLFAWGINKGFDMKDESFMLTCYRFPDLYAGFTTSFHLIVSRIFGAFNFGLLQYRIAGFTLKLLATCVFAWGFWLWLSRQDASGDSQG